MALALQDYEAADRAFAAALVLEPGSGRAYLGRSKALAGLGKLPASQDMLNKARVAWTRADGNLPEKAALHDARSASY